MDMNVPFSSSALMEERDASRLDALRMMSLRPDHQLSERQMREIANQFETVLLRQVLKEMRKTVPQDEGIMGNSHANQMYMDIVDDHLAEQMAASNNLGLEDLIVEDLKRRQADVNRPNPPRLRLIGDDAPDSKAPHEDFFPLKNAGDDPRFLDLKPRDAQAIPLPPRETFIPLERTRVSTSRIDNP